MPQFFSAALLLMVLAGNVPVASAVPARRAGEPAPRIETCEPSRRHIMNFGPGRRPGATAVLVAIRSQVFDVYGRYTYASSDQTMTMVKGDEVRMRLTVSNNSIYNIGNIVIDHKFGTYQPGLSADAIVSVEGASYDSSKRTFTIKKIENSSEAIVTFRILLNAELADSLSQSRFEIKDFTVLEADRRFPQSTPETTGSPARQNVVRIGIGSTAVSCFTAGQTRTVPVFPYAGREDERPVRTTQQSTTSSTQNASRTVLVEKNVNAREVRPGTELTYSIMVINRGNETLSDIEVQDRFSTRDLRLVDTGGGRRTAAGLQWTIDELAPEGRWLVRYRARVGENVRKNSSIPSTVLLRSEDLAGIPTTQLQASAVVRVVDGIVLPQTGVDMFHIFFLILQVLLGALIAFSLFGAGMWVVVRRAE